MSAPSKGGPRPPGEDPDSWPSLALQTAEPTVFGRGWISGVFAAVLGLASLGAVLCFHFPGLTVADIRAHYPVEVIRGALHVTLVGAFLLATISICLRRNKTLGLVGLVSTLLATLLGGPAVEVGDDVRDTWLGLDWVVLDLVLYTAVFIPLERLFALRPEQPTFRRAWATDLAYFFLSSLLVQILGLLTVQPAMVLFQWARVDAVATSLSSWPLWLQAPLCLLVADLTQYWVHRAFHQIPWLWRFHAIHHSAETMDWMAGSRLHFVDAVATCSLTVVPLFLLGFSEAAVGVYVVVVVVQATFIHANVRWEFPQLQRWVATPCYHHWHHAAEPQAVDKNFSVHSPLWDRVFGTYYMPGRWPERYGLSGPHGVPDGWARQFLHPFRGAVRDT